MMSEKRFTLLVEDDGYWIRDESNFKIIATGLKFGVAENLIAYLDRFNDENKKLKKKNEWLKKARDKSDTFIVKKGLGAEFLEWCVENE